VSVEVVVELMVAEPVEALKRPQEKANEDSGFDASTSSATAGSATRSQYLKIDFRDISLNALNNTKFLIFFGFSIIINRCKNRLNR